MDKFTDKLSHQIRSKALELKRLKHAIQASLPLDCHHHFQVAGVRDRQLIILTDSPVWQTRLRMYSQSMLEALEQHTGTRLNQVKIRLSPAVRQVEEPPAPPRTLSPQSGRLIEQTASCISDERLQAALLKLSSKAKTPEK